MPRVLRARRMNPMSGEQREAARDELLASLLAQLTDALRAGQMPDIDRLAAEHPDLSGELRELWTAVLMAEGAAASRASGELLTNPAAGLKAAADLRAVRGIDYEMATAALFRDGADSSLKAPEDSPRGKPASPVELRRCGDYVLLDELGRG